MGMPVLASDPTAEALRWLDEQGIALVATTPDTDLLYTDVWISMGKEAEATERIKILTGYQINQGLRNDLDKARVEIKVDSKGNAALVGLLIGDRFYGD